MRRRFFVILAGVLLATWGTVSPAAADLIVYDNASENGFDQSCTFGGTASDFDFANASPVHSVGDSIRFTPADLNAVSWCTPSAYSALSDHSGISFWIYLSGDASEGAKIDLVLGYAGSLVASQSLQALYGSPIATNSWVQIQASFAGASISYAGMFDQIALEDDSGTIQANVYIDDVSLTGPDRIFGNGFDPTAAVYAVSASAGNANGTISPASQLVTAGGTATFRAVPDSGFYATLQGDTWSVSEIGTSTTWVSGAITQDCTVTATFAPYTYNLTLLAAGTGTGSITPNPVGTSCGTGCYTYDAGTPVSITAVPSTGSSFTSFSGGGCSTTNPCDAVITANTTVTATFTLSSPAPGFVAVQPSESGAARRSSRNGALGYRPPNRPRAI